MNLIIQYDRRHRENWWVQGCKGSDVTTRFKGEHCRLYPLIGKRVVTPKGPGKLWRVFTNSVGVVLESSPDQVTYFDGPQGIHSLSDSPETEGKAGASP